MTKQISGEQEIGGVPILRVRDWLSRDSMRTRSCLVACFHRWKLTRYEPEEHISHRVTKLMSALLELGYIVEEERRYPDESQFYKLTKVGEEFARASGAKRLKRETAAQTLESFMSRVAEVNADPRFLVRITRAVAYGSYVRGEETVGDLDLAVDYESKLTGEKRKEAFKKHFKASERIGRSVLAFILIARLCRQNKLSHRPTAAVLVLRALEAHVLFNNLETVARQRQDDG